jgi:TonB family protein
LLYDSAGALVGKEVAGDWTEDGFVVLDDVHTAGPHLVVEGRRLLVTRSTAGFQFSAAKKISAHGKDAGPVLLKIDVDFGTNAPSVEQADTVLSGVFLTGQDSLADLVPEYWKPCVREGLIGKDKNCSFSTEVMAIPGVALSDQSDGAQSGDGEQPAPQDQVFRVGNGVSSPRAISQPWPEFSDGARGVRHQGVITLRLIVSAEGKPTKIRILSPQGAGLDAKAVHAVESWRFEPARLSGQPVPVEVTAEVDFHLY